MADTPWSVVVGGGVLWVDDGRFHPCIMAGGNRHCWLLAVAYLEIVKGDNPKRAHGPKGATVSRAIFVDLFGTPSMKNFR